MKYEEMSDFEIDKLVSSYVDFGELIVRINERDETIYLLDKDGAFEMLPVSYFAPCNNPIDAWPIIERNKINIQFGIEKVTAKTFSICIPSATDKSPLRAAMICFLRMKDCEK